MRQMDRRIEELKNKSVAIQAEHEAKRKELAAAKLELFAKENSEELRITETELKCRDAADFNKHQIEQNHRLKLAKKEVEAMIDGFMLKHNMKAEEQDNALLRRQIEERLYDNAILKSQILEKAQKIKDELNVVVDELASSSHIAREYEEDVKCEKLKEMEARRSLAKEKYEDMILSLEAKKKRNTLDRELTNLYMRGEAPLTYTNPQAESLKKQLKLEQDLFVETQRNLKEQLRMIEAHEEELRQLEQAKAEEREVKEKQQTTMMRNKKYKDVLQTQVYQIIEKKGKF